MAFTPVSLLKPSKNRGFAYNHNSEFLFKCQNLLSSKSILQLERLVSSISILLQAKDFNFSGQPHRDSGHSIRLPILILYKFFASPTVKHFIIVGIVVLLLVLFPLSNAFCCGKILGVHFLFYFVGRSSFLKLNLPVVSSLAKRVPILGIKVDNVSLQRVAPRKRAIMFASGAVASMISPLICVAYAILYLPAWIGVFISVLTLVNITLTLFFSSKVGDFWRAKKILQA